MAKSKTLHAILDTSADRRISLAIAEIRLILARLFWRFDIELADKDSNANWILRQKTMLLWDKGSLMVKVTPVLRS